MTETTQTPTLKPKNPLRFLALRPVIPLCVPLAVPATI